jgi:hypothetical protein
MICSFCGAKIPKGQKTCPACGAAINLEEQIPVPSPYYKEVVGEDKPAPAAPAPILPPEPAKWETPEPVKQVVSDVVNDRSNWAIASLVLAVIGLCSFILPGLCSLVTSVPAVILGFMGLKSRQRAFAIGGIALGILEILIVIGMLFLLGLAAFLAPRFSN